MVSSFEYTLIYTLLVMTGLTALLLGWTRYTRHAFKKYAENVLKLDDLLDLAFATKYYNRLAVIRVENNGGIPRLGHSVYFTVIAERYDNYQAWRHHLTKWKIDYTAAKVISASYSVESTPIMLLESMDGLLRTLVESDKSSALGSSIVFQSKKELYLLVATYDIESGSKPYADFELQAMRIKQLFLNR